MWMKLSGWSNRADQNYYFCGRSTVCMITKASEQGGACVEGVCACGRVWKAVRTGVWGWRKSGLNIQNFIQHITLEHLQVKTDEPILFERNKQM